MTGKTWRA